MTVRLVRLLTGLIGLALLGTGVSLLLEVRDPAGVWVWLGAAVLLHDALIAPLVLLIGLVAVRGAARGAVRGALLVAGALTAIALPPLLRPGPRANPSVLPLDYPRNLVLCLLSVAAVTLLLVLARTVRRGRHDPPRRDDAATGGITDS
ncbi:hypothetical protein ACFY3O_14760 [Streptomyces sp. NPDC001046]|uniref:hypothetical protein n=1 Tax=Streptomyces sp. NPDC001046 TaxID=3364543 RepID=UPI0036C1B927